jgi:hypothetical protein
MRIAPIGLGLVLDLAIASVVPLLPPLLVAFPLDQLVVHAVTLLFGV